MTELQTILVAGLASAFLAYFVASFSGSPQWIINLRQHKPFGCILCMSFWSSLTLITCYKILYTFESLSYGFSFHSMDAMWLVGFIAVDTFAAAFISILFNALQAKLETFFIN